MPNLKELLTQQAALPTAFEKALFVFQTDIPANRPEWLVNLKRGVGKGKQYLNEVSELLRYKSIGLVNETDFNRVASGSLTVHELVNTAYRVEHEGETKTCPMCGEIKVISEFEISRNNCNCCTKKQRSNYNAQRYSKEKTPTTKPKTAEKPEKSALLSLMQGSGGVDFIPPGALMHASAEDAVLQQIAQMSSLLNSYGTNAVAIQEDARINVNRAFKALYATMKFFVEEGIFNA